MLPWSISRELRQRQQLFRRTNAGTQRDVDPRDAGIKGRQASLPLNSVGLPESADGIVISTSMRADGNPLRAKSPENPMRDILPPVMGMPCQSLGIEGWSRLKVVELRALKRPLAQALAFLPAYFLSVILASSRFSAMTNFRTLPFYLYQQISSYRSDGAVTALICHYCCSAAASSAPRSPPTKPILSPLYLSFADAFYAGRTREQVYLFWPQRRGEKHAVEFNCWFSLAPASGTLLLPRRSYVSAALTPSGLKCCFRRIIYSAT